MPKLYVYYGLVIYFYANDHEPIHVHGAYQNFESKAELIMKDGKLLRIAFSAVNGRRSLPPARMRDFRKIVQVKADDIVRRWIEFFVFKKQTPPENITTKL